MAIYFENDQEITLEDLINETQPIDFVEQLCSVMATTSLTEKPQL